MGAERPPYSSFSEDSMTATNSCAVQMSSTITVSASGTAEDTATFYPAVSCAPFSDLGISVVPLGPCRYKVEVFHNGELQESHTFPSALNKYVCHMSFAGMIFPANIGTNAIPKYFGNSRTNFPGISMAVIITNLSGTRETFFVYTTFLEYDHCRFAQIKTIDYK